MSVTRTEAEEALEAIESMVKKTRHSIARESFYVTLIITGIVWFIGFTCTQFLPAEIVGYIWIGLSILGSALGAFLGIRRSKRIRSPLTASVARRVLIFWLLLVCYGIVIIAIAKPTDGKQATIMVILFIMLGQLATGLLFSFFLFWWVLPITALALTGYYLLPDIFYLWMAILGGGGMIAFGLYIRFRW
jgi:hypothetical protein